ncbi:hypothetical protein SVAN01_10129 [Stagonosporopsis vannaccii]|nr:hypothetical protein SVAN01_10129 [Stagonosporopsis vannaccii]
MSSYHTSLTSHLCRSRPSALATLDVSPPDRIGFIEAYWDTKLGPSDGLRGYSLRNMIALLQSPKLDKIMGKTCMKLKSPTRSSPMTRVPCDANLEV